MPMLHSSQELSRVAAMTVFETDLRAQGYTRIAGVDEAGRGPLAGPVVAAACILPAGAVFPKLNDSKQLSPETRETLFEQITTHSGVVFGIGKASVLEIDTYNILQATFLAMQRAIVALSLVPDYLLVDGNQLPRVEIPAQAIIKGDARSASIAAASILAKVTRDRLMVAADDEWPQYGFRQHKGYGTKEHIRALEINGPSPLHRRTFTWRQKIVQMDLF